MWDWLENLFNDGSGANVAAGVIASGTLAKLVDGAAHVACEAKATDRYGRTVAICRADGRDLGQAMVRLGMAWAFTRYSGQYVPDQDAAATDNLGIHRHACIPACSKPLPLRPL